MTRLVPYLAEEAIEQDAEALLAEYARACRIAITPPIPIDDIVEKHLKLGIEFDDTHNLFGVPRSGAGAAPDILGAIFFNDARIVIDESLDPEENPSMEGRYRFTLAHEGGGHWRLHRRYFVNHHPKKPAVICRSSQAKARIEWQADFYAACILMPRELVLTYFDPRRFSSLSSAELLDYQIAPLARQFGVSTSAMSIRLHQLCLLAPADLDRQDQAAGVQNFLRRMLSVNWTEQSERGFGRQSVRDTRLLSCLLPAVYWL